MKRIENPHVAARRGKPPSNKEHSRNYSSPEKNICLAYRRFRHQGHHAIPCLQLSLNGRPGTYSSTEHGFATLFQNAPDSPASQQFTSDGGGSRKRGITRNCRIWRAVSGQNGKFPAIRIISFPVLRPFSGTCPQAGIRWPPKERKWRLRPAWPTGNGPPTR